MVSGVASEQIERILADFIVRELAPGTAPEKLAAHEPLFESVLDSANILDLVNFIEERFAMPVSDLEITPGNFSSLGRLTAFIARKQAAPAAAESNGHGSAAL